MIYQHKIIYNIILILGFLFIPNIQSKGQLSSLKNNKYQVAFSYRGVSSFKAISDSADLFTEGDAWGSIHVKYRVNNEDWFNLFINSTRFSKIDEQTVLYTDSLFDMALCMKRFYTLKEDGLHLRVELTNTSKREIELGDVVVPVKWNSPDRNQDKATPKHIFEKTFIQKQNISLNASFLTFSKPAGTGEFYLMTTGEHTPLEFFDYSNHTSNLYIHSGATAPEIEGNWRLPHSTQKLAPAGKNGSSITYQFLLTSVSKYEDLRSAVYNSGLLDVRAAPGYTVPQDLSVKVAIRLNGTIDSLKAEYPNQTIIRSIGKGPNGAHLFEIDFDRLGENMVRVYYNGSEQSILEFFSTEPIETLIKKRSAFIVNHQQHKQPGKWWDGLYSVYDMKQKKLRGPEDTDGFDGWWAYVIACDDPILGKAPFVAAKNAVYPDSTEIASLEYHIKNFVWGKLQRSDEEKPYPYAVYGVPNWHVSRDSLLHSMIFPNDFRAMQIWRAYDYPHIIKLYYHMYEIAQSSPELMHDLDADGYLERAYQTAVAYYTYPYEVWSWFDTYKWGIYNEKVILDVITALEKNQRQKDADYLRSEWEKKAKYFIYDDEYPFRSEHSFDRTAFESSFALAKYAVENPMKPDQNLWYDKNKIIWYSHPEVSTQDAKEFMDKQHYAGLSVRGWLMPKYYLAGADCASAKHTHEMSYMSMMGGWSVLEYGLYYSNNTDWLELGYNSYLSSWSLMNTGNKDSDYGYWFPGKENDGATGWAFMSAKSGQTWLQKNEQRGVWHYDGEIDLGYGAAFNTARTIVVQDSVFGLHAYGGTLTKDGSELKVIPKDGVRQQFSYVLGKYRYHLALKQDGFAKDVPVIISSKGEKLKFVLENREVNLNHTTLLKIRSEKNMPKKVITVGKELSIHKTQTGWEVNIPVKANNQEVSIQF
ncbi:DUF5695 domain-containing protein [Plebeiibacterium sediminum]|uniref:DUF5695 domain-containing protein n=1 Tax=Plebeiibacterium sediminum TaxID=2992112 RepID=A0AAE3M8A7_9BACT|nr:DUF5695 domain-containing protein [Plebeiobacterium sediminum]MCW3788933.1 DUF5695 domain-containing protein [Plebeiobacterium sediminum]